MLYMVKFTINIPPMSAYIPYMDPMGNSFHFTSFRTCPAFSSACVQFQQIQQFLEPTFGQWFLLQVLSELASAESVNFHLIGVLREGTALATNQQNATATQLAATDKCQVTGVQMDRQYISHSETHSFTLWL